MKTIDTCPFCGSESGFYRKGRVSGTYVYYYDFNGDPADNTHMHDGIRYNETKSCYCADCEQKLPIKHPTQ